MHMLMYVVPGLVSTFDTIVNCSYVFYTHPRPATHWLGLNGALIVLYTLVMIAGAAAAIRGVILDAQAR